MQVAPIMSGLRLCLNSYWICLKSYIVNIISKFYSQVSGCLNSQIGQCLCELSRFKSHLIGKTFNFTSRLCIKFMIAKVSWVSPFIFTLYLDLKWLTYCPNRWTYCQKFFCRSWNYFDSRLLRQGLIAIGGDRIDQRVEFITFLTKSLKSHSRRAF